MIEWFRKMFRKLPEPETRLCNLRWLSEIRRCVECTTCHRLSVAEFHGKVPRPACPHLEKRQSLSERRPVGMRLEIAAPYGQRTSSRPPAAVVPIRRHIEPDDLSPNVAAYAAFAVGTVLVEPDPKVTEVFKSGEGGDFGGAGATGTWKETPAPIASEPEPEPVPIAEPEEQICRAPEPESEPAQESRSYSSSDDSSSNSSSDSSSSSSDSSSSSSSSD